MNQISIEQLFTSTKCSRDIYEHEKKEDFVKCRIISSAISTGIGFAIVTIIMLIFVGLLSLSDAPIKSTDSNGVESSVDPASAKAVVIGIWLVISTIIGASFGYSYISAGKTYDIFDDEIKRKMEVRALTRPQAIAAYTQELKDLRDQQLKQQQVNAMNAQAAGQTAALFSIASALSKK